MPKALKEGFGTDWLLGILLPAGGLPCLVALADVDFDGELGGVRFGSRLVEVLF